MTRIVMAVTVVLSLAGCGIKGEPQRPLPSLSGGIAQ